MGKGGSLVVHAIDGKMRMTDVVSTSNLLRLIQSIPSPKAEPFKMWLAQVGSERLDEIADPEKAILRGADFYRAKGYTEGWINQRLQSIEMRKELTDEWKARGIEIVSCRHFHLEVRTTKFGQMLWMGKLVCVSIQTYLMNMKKILQNILTLKWHITL